MKVQAYYPQNDPFFDPSPGPLFGPFWTPFWPFLGPRQIRATQLWSFSGSLRVPDRHHGRRMSILVIFDHFWQFCDDFHYEKWWFLVDSRVLNVWKIYHPDPSDPSSIRPYQLRNHQNVHSWTWKCHQFSSFLTQLATIWQNRHCDYCEILC